MTPATPISLSSLHAALQHFHTILSHQNLSLHDTINTMENQFQTIERDIEQFEMGLQTEDATLKVERERFLGRLGQRTRDYTEILNGTMSGVKETQNVPQNAPQNLTNQTPLVSRRQKANDDSTELDKLTDESLNQSGMHDESTILDDLRSESTEESQPQQQSRVFVSADEHNMSDDNLMRDIEFGTPSPMLSRGTRDAAQQPHNSKMPLIQSKTPDLVDIKAYARQQEERHRNSIMGTRWSIAGNTHDLGANAQHNKFHVRMMLCTQQELQENLPPYLQISLQVVNECISKLNQWLQQRDISQFEYNDLAQVFSSFTEQETRAVLLALLKLNRIGTRTQQDGRIVYLVQSGAM